MALYFEIGDRVKWLDYFGKGAYIIYSNVPNYGKIVKLTPKFADVLDSRTDKIVRVRQSELLWD